MCMELKERIYYVTFIWKRLNRVCKSSVKNLGANETERAITGVSKALGVLEYVISNYDEISEIGTTSNQYKRLSFNKDVQLVVDEIHQRSHVFRLHPNRSCHSNFKKVTINMIANIDDEKLASWMLTQMN